MRGLLSVTVAIALAGSMGVAQTSTQKPAKKAQKTTQLPKKAAPKTAARKAAPAAPVAVAPAAPVAVAPVAAPAPQVKASVAAAQKAAAPKRFSFGWLNWNEIGMKDANYANTTEEQPVVDGSQSVRFGYKLTDSVSARLAVEFDNNYALTGDKTNGKKGFYMQDPYLQVAHSKLTPWLSGYLRYYIPASQENLRIETYGNVRAGLTAKGKLGGGFALSYDVEPRGYINKFLSVPEIKDDVPTGKYVSTASYRLSHWGTLEWSKGPWTVYQAAGLRHYWYNQEDSNDPRAKNKPYAERFLAQTGLGYDLIADTLNAEIGVITDGGSAPNLLDQKRQFSLYRDDETAYYLQLYLTL